MKKHNIDKIQVKHKKGQDYNLTKINAHPYQPNDRIKNNFHISEWYRHFTNKMVG